MANFSDNISIFLKAKGLSARALEQQIGCSNGVISRCISKGTDISSQWVSKIIETYPDINPSWLLSGIGDMYLNPQTRQEVIPTNKPDITYGLLEYLKLKDQEIGNLREEIGKLKATIEIMEKEKAAKNIQSYARSMKSETVET